MAKKPESGKRPIVIRREEVVEGGHHGGAWKVAYADFVTAMMAFFLLMWLLNATTEVQRRGLADYFTPNNVLSRSTSGNGLPFGGKTPFDAGSLVSDRGAMAVIRGMASETPPAEEAEDPNAAAASVAQTEADQEGTAGAGRTASETPGDAARGDARREAAAQARALQRQAALQRAAREQAEKAAFEGAARQIRDAVAADPALAALGRQIAIDQTPEGLRIQLLDEDRLAMFATGSAVLNDRARLVLQKIAPILAKLPEGIAVSGHTDAAPYRGGDKSNWELSTERANATRRLLIESGLPESRFRSVSGNADRDLLLPADPLAAANRRIAIVALRDVPPAHP